MADIKLTPEQQAAIEAEGKIIVSASAGSGKTFVMIERLVRYITEGGDLDRVLAVTFTRKAAAQMKEKLREKIIDRINGGCTDEVRLRLKAQLAKIPTANISTIHSFCTYLLRTHFYSLDIDGSFDILSEDNDAERQLKTRAMDGLFDRLYAEKDERFLLVLSCYTLRRSDASLRKKVMAAHSAIRTYDGYEDKLANAGNLYTEENFNRYSAGFAKKRAEKCRAVREEFEGFMPTFKVSEAKHMAKFNKIYADTVYFLKLAERSADICDQLPKFDVDKRPTVKGDENKAASDAFGEIRARAKDAYELYGENFSDRQTELENFYKCGRLASAFGWLVAQFDSEYAAIKREEGKLDYNDLEHFTLKLLRQKDVQREVQDSFDRVFVDEYQDVNPVQEAIISAVSGQNVFLVGDVKQAIYGFRGSKSKLFTDKIREFGKNEGAQALNLSYNFRSAPAIVDGVNAVFSASMTEELCGINYIRDGAMASGGGYPANSGGVTLHVFGKDVKQKADNLPVYSVAEAAERGVPRSREGMAVVDIVNNEIGSAFFDLKLGAEREITPADICILARKNDSESVNGIVRELTMAGYPVSCPQGANVCDTPECKQIIDILSYIDNGEQDIPMASAMLSPLGGFTENELAKIRIADKTKGAFFRDACVNYVNTRRDGISQKLVNFYERMDGFRRYACLFGAASVIDKILTDGASEAAYMRGNGAKLKNVRRLAAEAVTPAGELSVSAFLNKLKGGAKITLAGGGEDSIKVMTMHASKGLEFPVVILADLCKQFRGGGMDPPLSLDEELGFIHLTYDGERHIKCKNIVNAVYAEKSRAEDVKNEMNLLYVACTRAMYRLHIMEEEVKEYSRDKAAAALTHAELLDLGSLCPDVMQPEGGDAEKDDVTLIGKPDEKMLSSLRQHFKKPYAYAQSIDLKVKNSATAVLKEEQGDYYARHELFPEAQGDTGADIGTAYHRFLELCDFAVTGREGILAELESFERDGLITDEQLSLLDADNLVKILNMQVFKRVQGKKALPRTAVFMLTARKFIHKKHSGRR